jgi:hypothetical protein
MMSSPSVVSCLEAMSVASVGSALAYLRKVLTSHKWKQICAKKAIALREQHDATIYLLNLPSTLYIQSVYI